MSLSLSRPPQNLALISSRVCCLGAFNKSSGGADDRRRSDHAFQAQVANVFGTSMTIKGLEQIAVNILSKILARGEVRGLLRRGHGNLTRKTTQMTFTAGMAPMLVASFPSALSKVQKPSSSALKARCSASPKSMPSSNQRTA